MKARIIGAAIAAALLFAAGWITQGWRAEASLFDVKRQFAESAATAHAQALERYQTLERTKDEAIAAHAALVAQNADAAAAARRTADSLRQQLASVPTRIAAATESAIAEYANTAGELLSTCAAEYQWMARQADGHAADARLMLEVWPRGGARPLVNRSPQL